MSDSVSVDVEGAKVEGRVVHRSRADIIVEIVSPYGGMTSGCHFPYFVMGDPANDFRGPLGDIRAASLLTELYLLAGFVEGNKAQLRGQVAEMDAAVERLDPERFLTEDEYRRIRRELRARLRNGLLDNKSYQQLLVQARKKVKARQWEIHRLEKDFVKCNFPMVVPVGTREEVLEMLRSSPDRRLETVMGAGYWLDPDTGMCVQVETTHDEWVRKPKTPEAWACPSRSTKRS